MSILQYPEAIKPQDLQIWNNAAFDNDESGDFSAMKSSWSPLKPILLNQSESFESDSTKENYSPALGKPSFSAKSIKPLHPNRATVIVDKEFRDEKKIDTEIEETQMEIERLSMKLKALRLEKAQKSLKTVEKEGRFMPSKFMESKPIMKNLDSAKKMEDSVSKMRKRGVSLGPAEISSGIQFRKITQITPIQTIQNRRKSCFWKLEEIDETKERGKSLSLSPKSRKAISKIQLPKQAVTSIGGKKGVKKEEAILSLIQPKNLFKDAEKAVSAKKPIKTGRVVASRYSQGISTGVSTIGDSRKRSLPEENCKEDSNKRFEKKRVSWAGKSSGSGVFLESNRAKKKWEIPSEVVLLNKILEEDVSPSELPDMLPKIKTMRGESTSPRDSGAAKRVVDLIGKKSYFSMDEESEEECSGFRALDFAEKEEVEDK